MTRPAPYPATTKAKGWRFELDLEQVIQSDTWDLAAEIPMAQHALLMMWAVAWQQLPCGSMPADPELVRVKIKVPAKLWAPMRDVVMRGWWLAEDGRLYHNTITGRVTSMLNAKDAERTRKAEYRAKMDAARKASESDGSPDVSRGTSKGHTSDGHGKDDTGTGTGTGTGLINTPPPPPASPSGSIEVFAIAADWQPSPQFATLAKLAGLPMKDQAAIDAGLGGFKAYWLTQPHTIRTQAEWEHALVKSLKHEQARAASAPRSPARRAGGHAGFDTKDYTAGVNKDGSLA